MRKRYICGGAHQNDKNIEKSKLFLLLLRAREHARQHRLYVQVACPMCVCVGVRKCMRVWMFSVARMMQSV